MRSIAGGAFDSDNCWMMINYVQFKWLTERPWSDVGGVTKADQQLRRTKLAKLDSSSRAMGNDIIFDEYKKYVVATVSIAVGCYGLSDTLFDML